MLRSLQDPTSHTCQRVEVRRESATMEAKGNQRLNEADEKSIYERLNAAKRDRSKKESDEESIDDRMDRFAQLQKASFQLLVSSPNGWQSFLSRNYKARRVEFVNGKWRPISTDRRFDET